MSFHEGSKLQEREEDKQRLVEMNKRNQSSATNAIPIKENEKTYLPPDNGDICWTIGAKAFTRKEVEDMLYTQRSMIGNDLKTKCGNQLTPDMYKVLDNPRIPKF